MDKFSFKQTFVFIHYSKRHAPLLHTAQDLNFNPLNGGFCPLPLVVPRTDLFSCKSFAHAFESDVQKGSFSQNNFICHVWTYVLINIHKLISTIFLLCLKDFQQFPVVKALSDHLDQLQKQK